MTSKAYLSILNLLQETILQLVKSGDEADGNMFMVGDVKQSIYQFRLAEPRLFLRKYKEFTDGTATGGLKIDLNANFRSRSEVLQATNTVFSRIMDEAVGEIAYDEEAALKFSAKYDEKTSPVEFVVLNTEKSDTQDEEQEELAKAQQEVRYIIRKIKEIVASEQPVFNPKDSSTRPIRYSDIVVLMRSMTWAHDFVEEFRAAGIPLYANATKGYFEALEVMMMLNVLKVVDNPYQDIELASVLRAPFFGLTENDLAQVRLAKQNVPYFEALLAYMESPENSALEKKITRFFTLLEEWRHMARRGTLAQLIWHIYLETNYYEYVGTMSNGKQRQANLRALHDRALAYEKTSFRGLFRFLRFVDRMKARGEDLGVAKSIGEAENVVRLMTIHSSKGLEFPVVFVAAMSKKFNEQDFKEPYLFDQDFGLAVKAVNPKERTMYTSLPYLAMKEKKIAKLKAEEMRVLYVAMTRAKERLILVASVKDWSKKEQGWQMLQQENEDILLPAHLRAKASSYLEWVAPVIVSHADYAHYTIVDEELEAQNNLHDKKTSLWQVKILQATQYSHMAEEEKITRAQDEQQSKADKDLVALINERFTAIYPHLQATSKKSKTSVSEIKRFEALQQEEDINYNVQSAKQQAIAKRPQFLQTQTLTRAEMGTVMHAVMQHVPQQGFATEEEVAPFIQQLVERQLLTEKESTIVDSEKVMRFFDSSIGQRFKRATTLLREIPFTMSRQDKEGDKQIVQGVIDCLFEENGEWILLDYKTDKIRPPFDNGPALLEEMKRRYDIQLTIYSEAISKINNITIVQKVLYLFDCDDFVTL